MTGFSTRIPGRFRAMLAACLSAFPLSYTIALAAASGEVAQPLITPDSAMYEAFPVTPGDPLSKDIVAFSPNRLAPLGVMHGHLQEEWAWHGSGSYPSLVGKAVGEGVKE